MSKNGSNGHGPEAGGRAIPGGQGPRRDHRRGQLRLVLRAGRPLLQGRRPGRAGPGLMHVDLGGYHVRDIEFSAAFDIDADKVGKDLSEAIFAGQNNTLKLGDGKLPKLGVPVQRGMTHDGLGKYLKERITKAEGSTVDIVADPQGHPDRRRRLLPPRRLRAGDQVVRRADPRGRLRVRELHPGVHRARGLLEQPLQEGRPPDHRRRHQVAGRRDDHAPHARAPVRRPRREDPAHLAAQRRRQHGLLQHARARAAGVQEDLQDQRRHVDHGPRAAGARRPRRPVGLRAVARGPQVGAHPRRGPGVRRRAAERRAQDGGLGLPELRRHRHRRRALLQARAQPRDRRPARRPELVPHEVAAQPAARQPGARGDRGVHRRARALAEGRRRPPSKAAERGRPPASAD